MKIRDYFYVLRVPELWVLSFSVDFLWLEMEIVLKTAQKLKMRYLCNAVLCVVQQISMLCSNPSACVNFQFQITEGSQNRLKV